MNTKQIRQATRISLEVVRKQVELSNELLASSIPQSAKSTICLMVENLLHASNCYGGFNNLHWIHSGCKAWLNAGKPEKNKENFIIGFGGANAKSRKDESYSHAIQGEYSRQYFFKVN